MTAMNYKEATGVRARSNLSANAMPTDGGRLTDEQLSLTAEWLAKGARQGITRKLRPETAAKVADAILETLNRRHP